MASQITSHTIVCSTVQAQIKTNIKAPPHWPLWGEFTGDRWLPAQMACNAEIVSIWWCIMSSTSLQSAVVVLFVQAGNPAVCQGLGMCYSDISLLQYMLTDLNFRTWPLNGWLHGWNKRKLPFRITNIQRPNYIKISNLSISLLKKMSSR